MDIKTYASVADLSEEMNISKAKIFFFQKEGLMNPGYVISKKILVYHRKEAVARLNKIFSLQKKGMSLSDIKSKLHEKDHLGKNSLS